MNLLRPTMKILVAASLLTACGGKDKKEGDIKESETKTESTTDSGPATKLEGAWEIKRAEGIMGTENIGSFYEFRDNKMTYRRGRFTVTGTALITDSTFSFQPDGLEKVELYTYHFNGDTLVVVTPKNVGPVLYMIKK